MPLEGIQFTGQLQSANHFTDAALLGIFESKVEHNLNIKKPEGNQESNTKEDATEEKSDNSATGHYNENNDNENNQNVLEGNIKKLQYHIRFNSAAKLIEVVDVNTKQVIQSVSPSMLLKLIADLKYSSGVFVDNKI